MSSIKVNNISPFSGVNIYASGEVDITGSLTVNGEPIKGGGFPYTGSARITGSLDVTGSVSVDGSIVATNGITASSALITGTLTTETLVATYISSSIIYSSGSNIFGNQLTDTQQLTGSVTVTGSLSLNDDPVVTSIPYNTFSSSIESRTTVLEQASASFSLSIDILSSSYESFTETYNTGSFTGVFSGSFSGSFSGYFSGSVDNIDGATNYIAKFDSNNTIDSSVIYQSASHIAINEIAFTADNPEALYVFQTHPTSINVLTGKGNLNNYLQNNIQNTNQGVNASSDVVATANNGNETSNYVDMGINSENYNQNFIGGPNDAYLYSIANNLHIGSAATGSQHVALFVGGTDVDANTKLQLNPNNRHFMSGSLALTGSLNVKEGASGSFSGSFFGNGGGLTNISASSVIGLNLSLIGSGSVTASTDPAYGFRVNSNTSITGSLRVTGGITGSLLGTASFANNATYAATASSADNFLVRQDATASNLLVTNTITAQTLIVQTITSSVDFVTGSTKFGTQLTNTHQFTGSVTVTGSLSLNDSPVVTDSIFTPFSGSVSTRVTNLESTASVLTTASQSFAIVSSSYSAASQSLSIRTTDLEFTASVLTSASASFAQQSGSNSVRLTNLESTASVLTTASASFAIVSGSYSAASESLSTRTTNLESTASILTTASASFALVSSSYADASGSLSTRVTDLESTASVLTSASASFAQQSGSNSIRLTDLESTASVLTTASASFALVSSSYSAFSQSYNTGSFTGSFTGILTGTSSFSISSSLADNSILLNGTGSDVFATTGSNIFVGNQTVTGSLFTSGSNTLVGSTTLTGSLNVSGSTVQVGNNTLLGNTTLSGSIIISGTLGSTPSVKIYGDTQHNGYIRFDPVTTNIDTSISASYIFVSGSTNDLYFSQNGSGYSNVTRLRWLEGNLYTGLLNGGLITSQSSTTYQVGSGSGIIVNLNASLNDNPYPTTTYVNWPNLTGNINQFSASYDQTFVAISSAGTLISQSTAFLNGQVDTQIPVGYVAHQDNSTINGTVTEPSLAYGWKQRSNIFISAFGPLKLSGFNLAVSGSSTGSLIVGSGTAFLDGGNYQTDPNNPAYVTATGTSTSRIFRYYESGSYWVYDTNAGAGYGAIDPARYSNNGTLSSVGAGNWSIQRVFFFPTSPLSPKPIVVYYGNEIYATEADAIANIPIEPFTEAPSTAAAAIYLGAIVISGNGVFTNTNTFTIYPGGLFRQVGGSGGGGSLVTQTLAGLSDVNISGPTNGQPLVYNNISGKWENSSTLTATLTGNASTATSASNALTASFVLQAVSSSFATTASFVENAQTASYVLQAVSASFATSASLAQTASSADNFLVRQDITASNGLITGTLTAQTLIVQTVTSSVVYSSGSNVFGNNLNNTQQFTGSVTITGSLSLNDSPVVTDSILTPFSSSVSTRLVTLENASSSFASVSSSYSQASQSLSTITTNLESTASVLTTASQSFASDSGSNSIRLTNLESTSSILTTASASFALVSSSYSAFTLSYNTGSFTGSFTGDGSGLINIPASGIVGLNLSQIASGSATASISPVEGFRINTNTEITGSLIVTAGITGSLLGTASWAENALTSSNVQGGLATYVPLWNTNTSLTSSYLNQASNILKTIYNGTDRGLTLNYGVDSYILGNPGVGNNTYLQVFDGGSVINVYTPNYTYFNDKVGVRIIPTNPGLAVSGSLEVTGPGLTKFINTDIEVTGSINVSSGITGSLFGTASWAENASTASFVLNAVSASFAATASSADDFFVRQDITSSNLLVNNTITAQTLVVQTVTSSIVYSSGSNIFGNQLTDVQQFTGSINSTGSIFFTGLTSGSQTNIVSYDVTTGQLFYQVTASGGDSVTSSYALTASAATNFTVGSTLTIDRTLTDYATVASSVAGSNNLFTQATGSYTSAFFKYTVTNGTNARSGDVMAVWNAASVQFTDNSTLDIGSTTPVTASVTVVGTDVQFNLQTNTSGWSIKSLATYM